MENLTDNNKAYVVNWANYLTHVRKAFDNLLTDNDFVDVTLCCEGKRLKAHKMLLAACSNYFRDIFKEIPCQHPVVILKGVKYEVLKDIIYFIYNGEVSVNTEDLDAFLKTAELLEVSGLTEVNVPEETKTGAEAEASKECRDSEKRPYSSEIPKTTVADEAATKRIKVNMEDIKDEPPEEGNMLIETFSMKFENPEEFLQTDTNSPTHEAGGDLFYGSVSDTNASKPPFYECNICQKKYQLKCSLIKHKLVHSGDTECPICFKVLSRKTHLDRHLITKHNVTSPNASSKKDLTTKSQKI